MIVLVEIAIVLCSVLLVAIPAIAAQEQNQRMQKVSASVITTASEDNYVLGVYGNANEDDTIDMGDVVYTKLAIFGKKPKTELCDAKYDGRINVLDVIQTKLIILGKEKEITVIDAYEVVVTVHKPVKRIVVLMITEAGALRALNAADKIVGVGTHILDNAVFFPEISKLPLIGSWAGPGLDYEAILNLNPDLFMAFMRLPQYVDEEKLPGVPVISLGLTHIESYTERLRILGYILDKEEEAEEYLKWHEGWINKIKSRTEGLSEDEKPRVFQWVFFHLGGYKTNTKSSWIHEMNDIAGGIDISSDLKGGWPAVDPEWVIEQNPDTIVVQFHANFIGCAGYDTDDPSEMAEARKDVLNRLVLANVNAVKNGRVYIMDFANIATGGSSSLIGTAYMAKWFHPDLFEDLDPQAIHQEYLELQGFDYDLNKHGVFVYPPLPS